MEEAKSTERRCGYVGVFLFCIQMLWLHWLIVLDLSGSRWDGNLASVKLQNWFFRGCGVLAAGAEDSAS